MAGPAAPAPEAGTRSSARREAECQDGGVPVVPNEPADESDRIFALQEEVDQLKEAVASHAVVDQAIGMVVALARIGPDEGWDVLKDVSQHTNIKLRNVADLILIWGRSGDLPPEIRVALEEALDRYGPRQIPGAPPG